MITKTIAVIGASYLQFPLVEKAKALGLRTIGFAWKDGAVCADLFDEFYPISITKKEEILEILRGKKIDGVLTIASDVAVPTVNFIAKNMGLIGNSIHSSYLSTNKFAMRRAFSANGVNCPKAYMVKSINDLDELYGQFTYPLIVKPCDRSGSMAVTKVTEGLTLRMAVDKAISASLCGEAIIESFIDHSKEISVEGISWNGSLNIVAYTDKVTTGSPHFVEIGHHQPSMINDEIKNVVKNEVEKAVSSLDINFGATHTELMITKDGQVYVTEVGARMGGDFIGSDLVYLSTGYDFLKSAIEVCLGIFQEPVINSHFYSGIWFDSNQTKRVNEIITKKHDYVVKSKKSQNPVERITSSSERDGYFIYKHNKKIDIF